MPTYYYNGEPIALEQDLDYVAVTFDEEVQRFGRLATAESCHLNPETATFEVPKHKLTIYSVKETDEPRSARQRIAQEALNKHGAVRCFYPVYQYRNVHIIPTEQLIVGFKPGLGLSDRVTLCKEYNLIKIDEISEDEWVVQIEEHNADYLGVANSLSREGQVAYAQPDFITYGTHVAFDAKAIKPNSAMDPHFPKQYAPVITKTTDAWALQQGSQNIRIAILDEGVDTKHEDLRHAVVGTYDGSDNDADQEPQDPDAHGTACAGLAVAGHNALGIKGIGGGCSLLAVRIAYSNLRDPEKKWVTRDSWIARSIDWAWREGKADILSNSWGGGASSTAIENAISRARTQGRDGKGSIVIIAAGNDDGPVSFPGNLPNVLTVSASNEYDEAKTKRSRDGEYWWGSNYGPEVDIAAPGVHNMTTDNSGSAGYDQTNYVANFNGTSSATPIVAGAAGLVLSANPDLSESKLRNILTASAERVGDYPYNNGRNDRFGYGRLNTHGAVLAALQGRPRHEDVHYIASHTITRHVPISDNSTAAIVEVPIADNQPLQRVQAYIDVTHSYRGDLKVTLFAPSNRNQAGSPVLLHERAGGSEDDLVEKYDSDTHPVMRQRLVGRNPRGMWRFEVQDNAPQDTGHINKVGLEFTF